MAKCNGNGREKWLKQFKVMPFNNMKMKAFNEHNNNKKKNVYVYVI